MPHQLRICTEDGDVLLTGDRTIVEIGREPDVDLLCESRYTSRRHATLRQTPEGWVVEDTLSTNGTFLDGERISHLLIDQPLSIRLGHPARGYRLDIAPLEGADSRRDADETKAIDVGSTKAIDLADLHRQATQASVLLPSLITIGRLGDNDITVDDEHASGHHAELRREGEAIEIHDLGSRNGTFVNGRRVERAPVCEGDQVRIGDTLLRYRDGALREIGTGTRMLARPQRASAIALRVPRSPVVLLGLAIVVPPLERAIEAITGH